MSIRELGVKLFIPLCMQYLKNMLKGFSWIYAGKSRCKKLSHHSAMLLNILCRHPISLKKFGVLRNLDLIIFAKLDSGINGLKKETSARTFLVCHINASFFSY